MSTHRGYESHSIIACFEIIIREDKSILRNLGLDIQEL